MLTRIRFAVLWTVVVLFLTSCSGSSSPTIPEPNPAIKVHQSSHSPNLWGYFSVFIDPSTHEATVFPARTSQFTANVVQILNSNPVALTVQILDIIDGAGYTDFDVNATLTHPLTQTEYTGYDVRGVFISDGTSTLSSSLFNKSLKFAEAPADLALLNFDGYTRWFNPVEFTTPGLFGYTPGNFATVGFTSTSHLNAFKYYGSGLGATDDLWNYLTSGGANVGSFLPASSNTRNYLIRLPDSIPSIKFNYAVLANWSGTAPGDHPSHAPEVLAAKIDVTPDMYYESPTIKGGKIIFDIELFTWTDNVLDSVTDLHVQSPLLTTPSVIDLDALTPVSTSTHTAKWHVEIDPTNLNSSGDFDLTFILPHISKIFDQPEGPPNGADADPLFSVYFSTVPVSGTAPDVNLPGEVPITLTQVMTGLSQPINVANAGDGTNRLFVVERAGRIRIIEGGVLLATPFLNITSIVQSTGGEQGLLSVAFHPDYETNGYFYVDYTTGSGSGSTVVARYKVSANPNIADAGSAKQIITFTQPFSNHNGGKLQFGPDGYLYISTGDGGSGGDPQNNGQNKQTFLGKILRLDVDVDPQPYLIPADNPFVSDPNAWDEIWAYGLRNPWQFSFDAVTGDMYIADVGQNVWEEINFEPANSPGGVNYGWRIMEGAHCYPSPPCTETGELPVAEYSHSLGCSITGFGVYRGSDYPGLDGIYFAGDYCSGRVWGLAQDLDDSWVFVELLDLAINFTGAGEGEDGKIYVTSYSNGGSLWRLEPA